MPRLEWVSYPINCKLQDGFDHAQVEIDDSGPPVSDDRKQLEDRESRCPGILCGSSSTVPDGLPQVDDLDGVDGPPRCRVKKTIYWVSVMDGLQRVLLFTDSESLANLARKVSEYCK